MSHKDGDQTTKKKTWQTIVLGGGSRKMQPMVRPVEAADILFPVYKIFFV